MIISTSCSTSAKAASASSTIIWSDQSRSDACI
jgi:hypothetical protein